MWVPATFTEWAHDPHHPYYQAWLNRPELVSFSVNGEVIDSERVLVASVKNGYVKAYAVDASGKTILEGPPHRLKLRTTHFKGVVVILVKQEGA